jgi:ribosomal protein L24
MDEDGYLHMTPRPLRRGDRVMVQDGPLQGLIGTLDQEMDDRQRVIILLEAIEYQARILIEKRYLRVQAEAV